MGTKKKQETATNNSPKAEENTEIKKDNEAIEFGDEEYLECEYSNDDDYENPDNPFHEFSDLYYPEDDPFSPEERANLENAWDK